MSPRAEETTEESKMSLKEKKVDYENFVFIEKTPAKGDFYFNKINDIAMIVYNDYFRIFKERREGYTLNYPTSFCINEEYKKVV